MPVVHSSDSEPDAAPQASASGIVPTTSAATTTHAATGATPDVPVRPPTSEEDTEEEESATGDAQAKAAAEAQARKQLILAQRKAIRRRGTDAKKRIERAYAQFTDLYALGADTATSTDMSALTELHLELQAAVRSIDTDILEYQELHYASGKDNLAHSMGVYATDRADRLPDAAAWVAAVIADKASINSNAASSVSSQPTPISRTSSTTTASTTTTTANASIGTLSSGTSTVHVNTVAVTATTATTSATATTGHPAAAGDPNARRQGAGARRGRPMTPTRGLPGGVLAPWSQAQAPPVTSSHPAWAGGHAPHTTRYPHPANGIYDPSARSQSARRLPSTSASPDASGIGATSPGGRPRRATSATAPTHRHHNHSAVFEADDAFYATLPPPWNKVPRDGNPKAHAEYSKLLAFNMLRRFNGKTNYNRWRTEFMAFIHNVRMDFNNKVMALGASMDTEDDRIARYHAQMSPDAAGYRRLIELLEERYGGSERLVESAARELRHCALVTKRSSTTLEDFLQKLRAYRDVCQDAGLLGEMSSSSFAVTLLDRLDAKSTDQYVRYLERHRQHKTPLSLLAWAEEELAYRLRREDEYPKKHPNVQPKKKHKNIQQPKSKIPAIRTYHAEADADTSGGADGDFADQDSGDDQIDVYHAQITACDACADQHDLHTCPAFLALKPQQRRNLLAKTNRCFKCLRRGHRITRCRDTSKCSEPGCDRHHHHLIHGTINERQTRDPESTTATTDKQKRGAGRSQRPGTRQDQRHTTMVAEYEHLDQLDTSSEFSSDCYKAAITATPFPTDKLGHKAWPRNNIALRTLPVKITSKDQARRSITCNAFLDDGNSFPLLSRKAAKKLQLKGYEVLLKVKGVNGSREVVPSICARLTVSSLDDKVRRHIWVQVLEQPAGDLRPVDWNLHKHNFPHLANVPFASPVKGGIDLMFGAAFPSMMAALEPDILGPYHTSPTARRTPFGWTALGCTDMDPATPGVVSSMFAQSTRRHRRRNNDRVFGGAAIQFHNRRTKRPDDAEHTTNTQGEHGEGDDDLSDLVRAQWQHEQLGGDEDIALSRADHYAINKLKRGHRYANKRYQMPVAWKPGEPDFQSNLGPAHLKLRKLLASRIFDKEGLRQQYTEVFEKWEAKGYIKRMPPGQGKLWLSHFPVVKATATTTKCRPVFDGKMRMWTKALNDAVLPGPSFIADIRNIMLRFERFPIALGGDIQEMYLQIELPPEDRAYHHFLWQPKDNEPVINYQFQRLAFGNACAPFAALQAVRWHAEKTKAKYPIAHGTVLHSSLMDDTLDSYPTPEVAKQALHQLTAFYKEMSMDIRKIISNSKDVLADVAEDDRAPTLDLQDLDGNLLGVRTVRTLGVVYEAERDCYLFDWRVPSHETWTRRLVLSAYSALFDPTGKLTPVLVQARILFQGFFANCSKWEALLSPDELAAWMQWVVALAALGKLTIQRAHTCTRAILAGEHLTEIHIFADASTKAYGAAAYIVNRWDEESEQNLAIAKARVAPTKPHTVPRLELMACVIATQLKKFIETSCSDLPITKYVFWTDSKTALMWIRSDVANLKMFVANRVQRILLASNTGEWRWVPTDENPADLASRGLNGEEFLDAADKWFYGPDFLANSEDTWPALPETALHSEDAAREYKASSPPQGATAAYFIIPSFPCAIVEFSDFWERVPRYLTQVSFAAFMFKWLERARRRLHHVPSPAALVPPRARARMGLIKWAQREIYSEQMAILRRGRRLHKRDPLSNHAPWLDNDSLLRAETRIKNHDPAVLSRRHPFTKSIIRYIHEDLYLHAAGGDFVWGKLSSWFFVAGGNRTAVSIVSECTECRRREPKAATTATAPMPDYRVPQGSRDKPWDTIGIDCAGPYTVSLPNTRAGHKRWLLVITCAKFRAVHIELIPGLDTDSFLQAYARFLARRATCPARVVCDHGTNFKAGAAALNELTGELYKDKDKLQRYHAETSWYFVPPLTPWMGGVYERVIQYAKKAIDAILPHHNRLSASELETIATIAEGILNNRPLGYMPTEEGNKPVTPNMFISPGATIDLVPLEMPETLSHRWNRLQTVLDNWWETLVNRMSAYFVSKQKIAHSHHNLKQGDVVVVLDAKIRGQWPIGRIESLIEGKDNKARSAKVKVHGAVLERAVRHLAPLIKNPPLNPVNDE